jgi:hypothetical protein
LKIRQVLVAVGLVLGLGACNALLGVGPATLGAEDATIPDAGVDAGAFSCANYCSTIMANCTGNNAEYLSTAICAQMCPVFDIGTTVGDTADDTLGCRLFHAMAATTPIAADLHCRFAGPLGGDHCGDPREAFCALDTSYCVAPNPVPYTGGQGGCQTATQPIKYIVAGAGDLTSEATNTLNCRLWHMETAYTSAAYGSIHCPHTELMSSTCTQ